MTSGLYLEKKSAERRTMKGPERTKNPSERHAQSVRTNINDLG